MTYLIGWGRDDSQPTGQREVTVNTVEELDAVLDDIERVGRPQLVDITPASDDHDVPYGLQVGISTGPRSFVVYIGEPAGGVGYDPDLPAAATHITVDSGGEPSTYGPERLRVTSMQARDAAREYLRTGRRPTLLSWE